MSVAKGGGVEGVASRLCGRVRIYWYIGVANHDLQIVKHHVKTHAIQCKSLQIRLQIRVLFPDGCYADANHDLQLDLQLANHDLRSANYTLGFTWASYMLHVCSLWSLLGPIWSLSLIFGIVFRDLSVQEHRKKEALLQYLTCVLSQICVLCCFSVHIERRNSLILA